MKVGLVILAAGDSSRMGTPKELLPVFGTTLIKHLIAAVFETETYPITIVLGAHKSKIVPELRDMPISIIDNPNWNLGIGTSIKMGLIGSYMVSNVIDALVYLPTHMPYINDKIIKELIKNATENEEKSIFYCESNRDNKFPLLIKRNVFESILDLKPEEDFNKIISDHKKEVALINFELGKTVLQTRQDYFDFIHSLN